MGQSRRGSPSLTAIRSCLPGPSRGAFATLQCRTGGQGPALSRSAPLTSSDLGSPPISSGRATTGRAGTGAHVPASTTVPGRKGVSACLRGVHSQLRYIVAHGAAVPRLTEREPPDWATGRAQDVIPLTWVQHIDPSSFHCSSHGLPWWLEAWTPIATAINTTARLRGFNPQQQAMKFQQTHCLPKYLQ